MTTITCRPDRSASNATIPAFREIIRASLLRYLAGIDEWLCTALAALGRCVLDGFADYGRCFHGDPGTRLQPTQWREDDLARLLDVPPLENRS